MNSGFRLEGLTACLYTLSYVICLIYTIQGTIKGKYFKMGAFFCFLYPYVYYYLQPNLVSHIGMAIYLIVLLLIFFKVRFFVSCFTVVLGYSVITYSMAGAHILGFLLNGTVHINNILRYPKRLDLSALHVIVVLVLMQMYKWFMWFYREKIHRIKPRPHLVIAVNVLVIMGLLISSNLYVRFMTVYSATIKGVPRLTSILVLGYWSMVFMAFAILYLLIKNIVSHYHLNEVREYAERDLQTGVLNRQTGLELLKQYMKEAKESEKALTICFIDINNLKMVNDRYGHAVGDNLIEVVSDTIRNSLRDRDFVCRLGGDEFLIAYDNCNLEQAKTAWNRIFQVITKLNENPAINFPVSVSYGLSEYNFKHQISIKEFIEQADAAMYQHKSKYKERKRGRQEIGTSEPKQSEVLE